jgi:hypothetical protein
MLPDLHNPETTALGLEVAALQGKTIDEIRHVVDRGDCALVIATEDVPAGLPPEVMVKERNVYEGKPSLSWMYQADSGDWRHWYGHILDKDYVYRIGDPPSEIIFGQLYTTQARATPGMRVRPIATLNFDPQGICVFASDAEPQIHLLRVRSEKRQASMATSASGKPRAAPTSDSILEGLAIPFSLTVPSDGVTIDDWDSSDPRTGRFGWINDVELQHLMLMNARMDWRVAIIGGNDSSWSLVVREGNTAFPPIGLVESGLRVAFRSPAGDAGPVFDAYAGSLEIGIVDDSGSTFAADVFIAQRRLAVAPIDAPSAVLLRGHRQSDRPMMPAVTCRLLQSDQGFEVTSPNGTIPLSVIDVRRSDSNDAIQIFARLQS